MLEAVLVNLIHFISLYNRYGFTKEVLGKYRVCITFLFCYFLLIPSDFESLKSIFANFHDGVCLRGTMGLKDRRNAITTTINCCLFCED